MGRPDFNSVKKKLEEYKKEGGLANFELADIALPNKEVDGLVADFGDFVINDNWDKTGQRNDNAVKIAQIRKIFSEIKSLHIKYEESKGSDNVLLKDIDREILLLIPKITFAKSRKNLLGKSKNLGDIFILAIEACRTGLNKTDNANRHENFERLYQFMESLVAYHKQYSKDE